jgi:hypothetical protein
MKLKEYVQSLQKDPTSELPTMGDPSPEGLGSLFTIAGRLCVINNDEVTEIGLVEDIDETMENLTVYLAKEILKEKKKR